MEIETDAKLLSVEHCSLKSANFTATDRAQYIDEQYYLITQTVRNDNAVLVHSQQSFAVWICDGGALDSNPMELGFTSKGTKENMCLTIERSLLNTFLLEKTMTTLSLTGSYRCGQCQRKARSYFCSVSYDFECMASNVLFLVVVIVQLMMSQR